MRTCTEKEVQGVGVGTGKLLRGNGSSNFGLGWWLEDSSGIRPKMKGMGTNEGGRVRCV